MQAKSRTPVEYEVLEKSLIGNEIFEAGTKALYDGLPSENLKPLCAEGEARAAEYQESNRLRVAKLIADNSDAGKFGIKPEANIGEQIAAALAQLLPSAPVKRTAAA